MPLYMGYNPGYANPQPGPCLIQYTIGLSLSKPLFTAWNPGYATPQGLEPWVCHSVSRKSLCCALVLHCTTRRCAAPCVPRVYQEGPPPDPEEAPEQDASTVQNPGGAAAVTEAAAVTAVAATQEGLGLGGVRLGMPVGAPKVSGVGEEAVEINARGRERPTELPTGPPSEPGLGSKTGTGSRLGLEEAKEPPDAEAILAVAQLLLSGHTGAAVQLHRGIGTKPTGATVPEGGEQRQRQPQERPTGRTVPEPTSVSAIDAGVSRTAGVQSEAEGPGEGAEGGRQRRFNEKASGAGGFPLARTGEEPREGPARMRRGRRGEEEHRGEGYAEEGYREEGHREGGYREEGYREGRYREEGHRQKPAWRAEDRGEEGEAARGYGGMDLDVGLEGAWNEEVQRGRGGEGEGVEREAQRRHDGEWEGEREGEGEGDGEREGEGEGRGDRQEEEEEEEEGGEKEGVPEVEVVAKQRQFAAFFLAGGSGGEDVSSAYGKGRRRGRGRGVSKGRVAPKGPRGGISKKPPHSHPHAHGATHTRTHTHTHTRGIAHSHTHTHAPGTQLTVSQGPAGQAPEPMQVATQGGGQGATQRLAGQHGEGAAVQFGEGVDGLNGEGVPLEREGNGEWERERERESGIERARKREPGRGTEGDQGQATGWGPGPLGGADPVWAAPGTHAGADLNQLQGAHQTQERRGEEGGADWAAADAFVVHMSQSALRHSFHHGTVLYYTVFQGRP